MMSRAGAGSNVDDNKDGFDLDEEDEMGDVSSHHGKAGDSHSLWTRITASG